MDIKHESVAGALRVRVRAFARVREVLGNDSVDIELPAGSTVGDVQQALIERYPELAGIATAMRLARNGHVARSTETLTAGDEIALLPPVGGG